MGRSLIQKWFQSLALDLRSLALLRIAYGVCILQDLAIRATDLTAHYSDWGAQPSYLVTKTSWDPAFFSLHLMQTGREAQALFFSMAAFFSTCFLVGYRTRLAGWLSWFLLISVQNRNPIILDGGDLYLRCLLFWLLFCPLGARWSVDAARRPASSGESESVLHLGTLAYSLQLTLIYGWACALKTGKEWTVDGTAVQYAMRLDGIASPPAQWLLQHPDWMHKLNFACTLLRGAGSHFVLDSSAHPARGGGRPHRYASRDGFFSSPGRLYPDRGLFQLGPAPDRFLAAPAQLVLEAGLALATARRRAQLTPGTGRIFEHSAGFLAAAGRLLQLLVEP